jgi:hypothetical protein
MRTINNEERTMTTFTSDIAFTPAVKAIQERMGSRASYNRMEQGLGWASTITPDLAQFISQRDSFYMATASADGQPYIQHRGGPKGFLQVLDTRPLPSQTTAETGNTSAQETSPKTTKFPSS